MGVRKEDELPQHYHTPKILKKQASEFTMPKHCINCAAQHPVSVLALLKRHVGVPLEKKKHTQQEVLREKKKNTCSCH